MPIGQIRSVRPLQGSIEATPDQAANSDILPGLLPRGTSVYLTDLGAGDMDTTVRAATRLRNLGYEPVPHIAVRRITSQVMIEDLLARLCGEADVRDVLVIGGGVGSALGPYDATLDLLQSGLLDRSGITRIGVAGHPEGSPDISDALIEATLELKAEFARQSDADMRIVTQFGFDAATATGWLDRLGALGVDLPVHLGVAGPANISTLLKYAAMCGVGPSLGFLRKGSGLLTALATRYSPEAYVAPMEQWHHARSSSNLAGLHVFPFGGLAVSAQWLIERGSLVTPDGDPTSDGARPLQIGLTTNGTKQNGGPL